MLVAKTFLLPLPPFPPSFKSTLLFYTSKGQSETLRQVMKKKTYRYGLS